MWSLKLSQTANASETSGDCWVEIALSASEIKLVAALTDVAAADQAVAAARSWPGSPLGQT
jgi:hypothetical protein